MSTDDASADDEPKRWRSVDHVTDAMFQARYTFLGVRRDRLDDAVAERPDLFTRRADGRFESSSFAVGDHLGSLTLLERLTERPTRKGHRWRAACDCGRLERLVFSHLLALSVRAGREPCCRLCRYERTKQRFAGQRELQREAFRKQFVDHGTLWTASQTRTLIREVREALEETFGPIDRELLKFSREEIPSVRYGFLETEPAYAETGDPVPGWRGRNPRRGDPPPPAPAALVWTGGSGGNGGSGVSGGSDWRAEEDVPALAPEGLTSADLDVLLTFEERRKRAALYPPPAACPCGSGCAYAHCHGSPAVTRMRQRVNLARLARRAAEDVAIVRLREKQEEVLRIADLEHERREHNKCPCGSGKYILNCHRKRELGQRAAAAASRTPAVGAGDED